MVELKCENQQLFCCDAMLEHDTFILIPDHDITKWRLYSEVAYQALEQKLLFTDDVNSSARFKRMMLGSVCELKRQGVRVPLPEGFPFGCAGSKVLWYR